MSSPSSQAPPAEYTAGLAAALADVAERSFFGFVEVVERKRFDELAAGAGPWRCAEVDFRGPSDGVVRCAVPASLANELLLSFLGEDDDASPTRVDDLLGEFANMVCGTWLTRALPDKTFSLGRPAVAPLPSSWTSPTGDCDALVLATFNDQPVAVWLHGAL